MAVSTKTKKPKIKGLAKKKNATAQLELGLMHPKEMKEGRVVTDKDEMGFGPWFKPSPTKPRPKNLGFTYISMSQKEGVSNDTLKNDVETPPNIASEVFENTWHSIVMVRNKVGYGSGVIVCPGLVATNYHVIEGGASFVCPSEKGLINKDVSFPVKVLHQDTSHDFCVLEVNGLNGTPAKIRRYDTLKVGEDVYALGAPRGFDMSLSNGLISQLRLRGGKRYIQTNAAISPGSSGGGLFDAKSNFIGMPTTIYVKKDTAGIGFAIPADLVLEFLRGG